MISWIKRKLQGQIVKQHLRIEELETAIAYAHGRLESEEACPPPKALAESLRMLANERAAWIEVAIDHNKQCKQLNPDD